MNKDQIWKSILIVVLVIIAALHVYPPQEKLKQGIDLQGGVRFIYEIDTSDLSPADRKGLAQRMIPILMRRIDPSNVANIVMRPQGDTRIEIQLPLASADTKAKREAYDSVLETLDKENINLLKLKNVLALPANERTAELDKYSLGQDSRKDILNTLASVYDERTNVQSLRDEATELMEQTEAKINELGVDYGTFSYNTTLWSTLEGEELTNKITDTVKRIVPDGQKPDDKELTEKQKNVIDLLESHTKAYKSWVAAVQSLTQPGTGLNAKWTDATSKLTSLNLSREQISDVLKMKSDSTKRKEMLDAFKTNYPERAGKIDEVIAAYDAYSKVGGRLDDPEDLKRMLKGSGVLEFRILPTGSDGKSSVEELTAYKEKLTKVGPKLASDSRYKWFEIEDPAAFHAVGVIGVFGEKAYVLASNQDGECMLHSGEKKWKLKRAFPERDQSNLPSIGFTFDTIASNIFYDLTSNNLQRPLCILLDDIAISAPNIKSAISASGTITGSFTMTEVDDMVNKLNAGSFPARLSEVPISEDVIGPTIGADNRDQGINAGVIGLIAVAAFMIIYYRISGTVADVALILNMLFILGMMVAFGATFTLPGIAGLILTIGMSVDANVLIFERIREELQRGSSLRASISNGYSRAFRTIFDANLTTFFVAFILNWVGSEEIKGFAIVLMLGIISSMFTALFVTRVIFNWLTGKKAITDKLSMMNLIKSPSIDWMKMRPMFMAISGTMMGLGLLVFFATADKLDIEFTGGTSISFNTKPEMKLELQDVRTKFLAYVGNENKALQAAKIYEVGKEGNQFEIVTTETNKTVANVKTLDTSLTADAISKAIKKNATDTARSLPKLTVTPVDGGFEITTSRVSKTMVESVITDALADKVAITSVKVNELVSDAVRGAFKDYLAARKNLMPEVVSTEMITEDSEDAAYMSDYLGGLKMVVKFTSETTVEDIQTRIREIRFKADMQDLSWYSYDILKEDLTKPEVSDKLSTIVFVSVHPEAGYRELSKSEWDGYVQNETDKVVKATSLESTLSRVTQIDASIGSESKVRAVLAIVLSLIAIVGYIWFRFGTARYGLGAIIALVHDVTITLGLVTACTYIAPTMFGKALLIGDFKINLEMIAAFLTIIGYSLNDTIVVYDRIRENRGKSTILTPGMISNSINQTLSRTLLTSLTTFLVVLVMYIWGGAGLRGFTFAMLVGIVVGTYSSIAIASPILLIGNKNQTETENN